jgi:hypothetical protein
VQQRKGGRWIVVGWARTDARGQYRAAVPAAGLYRVVYRSDAGAPVRVPRR